jgi:uncharacterized membrane protein YidH (DUF202 family)
MNGIPWILVAILIILVLLGVVFVRKRSQPRRMNYRNYFVMGVVSIPTGLVLSLLPWLLHGEDLSFIGLFFIVMGLAYTTLGLVNRDKWGKQVEVPTTTARNLMILMILVGVLLVVGLELLLLHR